MRRVVVTGIGIVSPLGCGTGHLWERLLRGEHGIRRLEAPELRSQDGRSLNLPSTIAGTVPTGSGPGLLDLEKLPKLPAFMQYGIAASDEALAMSKWSGDLDRAGVAIGSGIGCLNEATMAEDTLQRGGGFRRLSPHFVPRVLINMAAAHVSLRHCLRGPSMCPVTACASGAHAIGEAMMLIERGHADMMIAGATEASVDALSLAGFGRMRALATSFNDQPGDASRPFDTQREGFVLAEGAAVLVLEEQSAARKRSAPILAELAGWGLSSDSCHITSPAEGGEGAERAMKSALFLSGLTADEVGYVNAHATSTPLGDAAEAQAIDTTFNSRSSLYVSSTKGATGHLLGAAGALEAAISVLALHDGIVPHTRNLCTPDTQVGFTHVMNEPRKCDLRVVMSNSFGFGGTNTSLIFTQAQ